MPAVTTGTTLACTMGLAPGTLTAGTPRSASATTPMATIADIAPTVNISPFGMCVSPANPTVAAATAAASGVLTPQPCLPATTTPWTPGSAAVAVDGVPVVTQSSTCACLWAGVISIAAPAQVAVSDL